MGDSDQIDAFQGVQECKRAFSLSAFWLCLSFSFGLSDSDSIVLDKMVISSSSGLSDFIPVGRRGRGGAISVLCIIGPDSSDSCD